MSTMLQNTDGEYLKSACHVLFGSLSKTPLVVIVDQYWGFHNPVPTTCFRRRYFVCACFGGSRFGMVGGMACPLLEPHVSVFRGKYSVGVEGVEDPIGQAICI